MTPLNVLKDFQSRYTREMIKSITEYCEDQYLKDTNLSTTCDKEYYEQFIGFINDYKNYKIENIHNEKAKSNEALMSGYNKTISDFYTKDINIKYKNIPSLISNFIEHMSILENTIVDTYNVLLENGVDNESVGNTTIYSEIFIEKYYNNIKSLMDSLLKKSGYFIKTKPKSKKYYNREEVFIL